jgi:predicted GNAT family acetyltransferase
MDWENWESLKPYLGKKKKEETFQESDRYDQSTIKKVKDFEYDKVYFGMPEYVGDHFDLDRPLFVTPYKGIATLFAVSGCPEVRKYIKGSGYDNLGYEEWSGDRDKLKDYLKEVHMLAKGAPDLKPTTIDCVGYVYEIDMKDVKGYIGKYPWMDQHDREYLICGQDEIKFKPQEVHVKMHIKGAPSRNKYLYYRFTYHGEGIYQALKKSMFQKTKSSEEWEAFKKSDACTWLDQPPTYGDHDRSYFTKFGCEMFLRKTYPVMKKWLDESDIKIEKCDVDDSKIVYKDKYQIVIRSDKHVQEAVYYLNPDNGNLGIMARTPKPVKDPSGKGKMYEMDEIIVPFIRLANKKGYKTRFCCSGHGPVGRVLDYKSEDEDEYRKQTGEPYIFFVDNHEFKQLPPGWYVEKDMKGIHDYWGKGTIIRRKMKHVMHGDDHDDWRGYLDIYDEIVDAFKALCKYFEKLPDISNKHVQETVYHDKCISYAMGVDDSIYDLKDKGFEIEEDDGDYCVTFDWSKRKIWEKYIESHIQDTYWNEYIRLSDITIHFMINENGKIQHVINHNYEEDDELLSTCNRLCEGSFKTIKSLIFSNDFYKKELKNRKVVQEAVDINSLRQQCGEVYQQALQIHYGCLDENGERITASPFKDSWKMISTYHSQSLQSLQESKLGVCFEHSFYVAELLKQRNLPCQTFFLNCNIDHNQPQEESNDETQPPIQESESIAVEQHNMNDMSFWHQFTIVPNDTDSIVLIETSLTPEKNGVFLVANMDDVVSHLIQTFDLQLSQEDMEIMKQDLIDVSNFAMRDGDTYIGYIDQAYLNGKFIKNEIRINHQTKTMKAYWQYLADQQYLSEDGIKINDQIQQMDDNTAFDIINLLNAQPLFTEEGLKFHQSFFDTDKPYLSVSEMESQLKGFVQESYIGMTHNTLKEKFQYIPLTSKSIKEYASQGDFQYGMERVHMTKDTKGAIYINKNHVVVAYVAVMKKSNGQRWIIALEVSNEYKDQGYDTDLLQIAVDDFGAEYLSISPDQTQSIPVYQQFGFHIEDKTKSMIILKLNKEERIDS